MFKIQMGFIQNILQKPYVNGLDEVKRQRGQNWKAENVTIFKHV